MRIIMAKVIAHTLLLIWLGIKLMIVAFFMSGWEEQLLFGAIVIFAWALANIWIALLSEHDYQGNP